MERLKLFYELGWWSSRFDDVLFERDLVEVDKALSAMKSIVWKLRNEENNGT